VRLITATLWSAPVQRSGDGAWLILPEHTDFIAASRFALPPHSIVGARIGFGGAFEIRSSICIRLKISCSSAKIGVNEPNPEQRICY
jgi:hypothetical protein